jgi:hypothetical protein
VSKAAKADLLSAIDELEQQQRRLGGLIERVRELAEQVAGTPAEASTAVVCPHDGLRFPSVERLDEHLANVHAA